MNAYIMYVVRYLSIWRVLALIFILFVLTTIVRGAYAAPSSPRHGVTINNRDKTDEGFTLFTPIGGATGKNGKNEVYLIDMNGRTVHSWSTQHTPGLYSYLLKNGNLLYAGNTNELLNAPAPGGSGVIQEINWNGEVVWEYKNTFMHHDFQKLPNGNVMVVVWEKLRPENEEKVLGGMAGTLEKDGMWSDAILEIDYKTKQVVWEWHAQNQLNFEEYPIGTLENRLEWNHMNSVAFLPKGNAYNGKPAVITSLRQNDSVLIIDYESKKVLWSWGKGIIKNQHDPSLMKNGNILVFDNGLNRPNGELPASKVVEVNPKTDQIVWEYQGGGISGNQFFSNIMGGAQELSNGNILITESLSGRIFEVARGVENQQVIKFLNMVTGPKFKNEIVWEYVSEYVSPSIAERAIFRAYRYGINDIKWPVAMPNPNSSIVTLKDYIMSFFK